ncbi:MAG: protein kinase [Myxococcota bacterium]
MYHHGEDIAGSGIRVGPYVVEAKIGAGGMGVVYRARHAALGGLVALKVLNGTTAEHRERFLQEGRAQSRIRHPNVLRVNDVVVHQGHPVLVLEYVDGGSLHEFLRRQAPLRYDQIDALARGILRGVSTVHTHRLVHRDLKPSNILLLRVDDRIEPKVADFGLAKVPRTSGPITEVGQRIGTPNYMAPEQLRSNADVDHRADLFALGCVLYELVTGHPAFPGEHVPSLVTRIETGRFAPVQTLRPDCPARIRRAIEACLAVDPRDRVQRCVDVEALWDEPRRGPWGDDTLHHLTPPDPTRWEDRPSPATFDADDPLPAVSEPVRRRGWAGEALRSDDAELPTAVLPVAEAPTAILGSRSPWPSRSAPPSLPSPEGPTRSLPWVLVGATIALAASALCASGTVVGALTALTEPPTTSPATVAVHLPLVVHPPAPVPAPTVAEAEPLPRAVQPTPIAPPLPDLVISR